MFVCLPRAPDCSHPSLEGSFVLPALPWCVCLSFPFFFLLIFQPIKQRWTLGFFDFPFILSEKWKSLCLKGRSLLFALLDCVCRKRWLA